MQKKIDEQIVLIPFRLYIVTTVAFICFLASLTFIFNKLYSTSTAHDNCIQKIIETKYLLSIIDHYIEDLKDSELTVEDIENFHSLLSEISTNIIFIKSFKDQAPSFTLLPLSYAGEYRDKRINVSFAADKMSSSDEILPSILGNNDLSDLSETIHQMTLELDKCPQAISHNLYISVNEQYPAKRYEMLKQEVSNFLFMLDETEILFLKSKEIHIKYLNFFRIFLLITSILMALAGSLMCFQFERRRASDLVDLQTRTNQLWKSEKRYRNLYKKTPAMMHSIDQHGRIVSVSNTWLETLGFKREEVIGHKFTEFITDESRKSIPKKIFTEYSRSGSCKNVELQYVKKNKEIIDVLQSDTVEKDKDGNFLHALTILHDVTELRRLQKELQQSQKMEAIGLMAGGIAHDFNNILTIIIGNAQMALSGELKGFNKTCCFEEILQAAFRASDLVRQILSFSRHTDQELKPVNPCRILKESLKLFRSITPATVEIVSECKDDQCSILLDITQFHQILMNLAANAIHAMNGKGILEITGKLVIIDNNKTKLSSCEKGKYFRLSISDTGCGIDENTLHNIFNPFFTTKDAGEGTGMGLSIVKRIVQSHGGYVTVKSKVNHGSQFHIFFPAFELKESLIFHKVDELPRGSERILIVDDEVSLAEISRMMFSAQGYDVTVKTCSLDALETFKENPQQFDLVITDQTMPYLSGTEMSSELLKERPELPIILYTGYSSSSTSKQEIMELGIRRYFTKPVDMNTFIKAVREVLDEEAKEHSIQ